MTLLLKLECVFFFFLKVQDLKIVLSFVLKNSHMRLTPYHHRTMCIPWKNAHIFSAVARPETEKRDCHQYFFSKLENQRLYIIYHFKNYYFVNLYSIKFCIQQRQQNMYHPIFECFIVSRVDGYSKKQWPTVMNG